MDYSTTSDYSSGDFSSKNGLFESSKNKKPILQKIFPSGLKEEFKNLMAIFLPIVFTSFFRFLNPLISLVMCGHLSKLEFDAASLANSLINIFGVSIDLGFSTAFDTLFAQIYGSDQKKKMGGLLQRATIVMTIIYLVLICFHLNIEPFLILLKQDPFIAEMTTRYITFYLPGLFFDFQFLTLSRYLQNQNIVYPMLVSSFVGNIFSGVSQYIAIYIYGYGLEASAMLQAAACFVMFILQLLYVLISKVYKDTWNGFSWRDSLDNWRILFAIGIPGIMMIALEEWNFEIATIVAGSLSTVQLGAQSIAFQCSTISFMITMGLSISTGIRVGQFLGSRDLDGLKTAYRTAIVVGSVTSTTSCILIVFLRKYIAQIFSNDSEIQDEGSYLLLFIAFMQFADIAGGITSGILKACGRQILGASIMFACYYLVGVPLGLVLVYQVKIEIQGMWIGLISALIIESILFTVFIIRTNWNVEFDKAMANLEELNCDKSIFENIAEKRPLIVKSDYEGDAHWVREKIYNPELKIKAIKRIRTTSDIFAMPAYRSRSMMISTSKTYEIDTDLPLRKTVIRRIITVVFVLILVVGCLMIRIYLPKSYYLPCIEVTQESLIYYNNDYTYLCHNNSTNINI